MSNEINFEDLMREHPTEARKFLMMFVKWQNDRYHYVEITDPYNVSSEFLEAISQIKGDHR